jgi:(4S)-4-hydroxy-5-phosphonooxypentane-2,3-dione isomerase
MLIVVEFIEAEPPHRAKLRAALLVLARAMLDQKAGCLQFEVGQDDLDGAAFFLYQLYATPAVHKAHGALPAAEEHRAMTAPWTVSRRILTYEHITDAGVA